MRTIRFWNKITGMTLGKLCQQPWLLAGLTLLCFLLPLIIGPAAEAALSEGVSFSGITLAVAAPEGDSAPDLLEKLLPKMEDVSQYCEVVAMDRDAAIRALERGEVTAVLVLPENLVQGIMDGTNPDVELIVPGDMPMEALLTLCVGQSASDLLSAVQSGVYAVLEEYGKTPPAGLSYGDAVTQINLRYVRWTLGRQQMFLEDPVAVTRQLPIGVHYGLSLLVYLALSLAPLFMSVYSGSWIQAQKRFRAVGRGIGGFYVSSLSACTFVLLPLMTVVSLLLTRGDPVTALGMGALCACFCAAFGTVCCLLTANTGSCGVVSFLGALVFLFLSGGVLPPVLLPQTMQKLMLLSPMTWLRSTLALAVEDYEMHWGYAVATAAATVALAVLGNVLYRRRSLAGEDSL